MKYDANILINNINYFYKLAGELKIPSKLNQEISNWVIGCFCNELFAKLHLRLQGYKQRAENDAKLLKFLEIWTIVYDYIVKISNQTEEKNHKEAEKSLFELAEYIESQNNAIQMPSFHNDEEEITTNFLGTIDYKKPCLVMSLYNTNGKYTVIMDIDFKNMDNNSDINELRELEDDLTPREAIEVILKYEEAIGTALEELIYFRNNYDVLTEGGSKQFFMLYGQCKKLLSQFDAENETRPYSKRFDINIKDLPYNIENKIGNDKLILTTSFLHSKKQIESMSLDEDFSGLWNEFDRGLNSGYIGKLYIYKDMEQAALLINDLDDLQKALLDVKTTVRHELQHFVQSAIKRITKNKQLGGLPSYNIIEDGYNASGFPKDKSSTRLQHSLRDVEFYTDLSDSIDDFNNFKKYIPFKLHKEYAKAWIGYIPISQIEEAVLNFCREQIYLQYNTDRNVVIKWNLESLVEDMYRKCRKAIFAIKSHATYFEDLKNNQPAKYRKACSEFIKTVGV